MNNSSFDPSKFKLGKLCKRNHDWNETGKTLLKIGKGGKLYCFLCRQFTSQKWKQENLKPRQEKHPVSKQDAKEAHRERCRQWRLNNRERCNLGQRRLREKYPERHKAYQQKYWSNPDNLAKRVEYNRAYRQRPDYPERHREYAKKHAKTEKGKATAKIIRQRFYQTEKGKALARECVKRRRAVKEKVHTASFTEQERIVRFDLFDGCCAYCGATATTIDHVIPLSKGGAHVLGNFLPSCKPCNTSKFNKDMETWYKASPNYTKARWKRILKVLGITEAQLGQLPLF